MPITADASEAPNVCAQNCAHAGGYQGRGASALAAQSQPVKTKSRGAKALHPHH